MSERDGAAPGREPSDPEPRGLDPATLAARALGWIEPAARGLVPPIHLATTFERLADQSLPGGRSYIRPRSPAFDQPEALLAALEGGAEAMLFASGMAAAAAPFQALAPGDHAVAPRELYWGMRQWLLEFARPGGLEIDFVDMTDLSQLAGAVKPGRTRLVWIETPANPSWVVTDIAGAAAIAHGAGALLAVDNTVATPVLSRPLALGADLVMHAATKYLNGHSDVLCGALVTARTDGIWQRLVQLRARPARCRAPSKPGCCCGACARSICGSGRARPRPPPSRGISRDMRSSAPCSIPAWATIPAMGWRRAR
jgi:cystathionine gamma-synthase